MLFFLGGAGYSALIWLYSLTYLPIHSLTHSLTHSTCLLAYLLTYWLAGRLAGRLASFLVPSFLTYLNLLTYLLARFAYLPTDSFFIFLCRETRFIKGPISPVRNRSEYILACLPYCQEFCLSKSSSRTYICLFSGSHLLYTYANRFFGRRVPVLPTYKLTAVRKFTRKVN